MKGEGTFNGGKIAKHTRTQKMKKEIPTDVHLFL
jgi:hypothetical protein